MKEYVELCNIFWLKPVAESIGRVRHKHVRTNFEFRLSFAVKYYFLNLNSRTSKDGRLYIR